ncbi:MAG: DUF2634 domain-containing protein [Oscillospiraceae bacterium]|nr:DUF2634 domain-containing protein [Oscillospiraceae bacterium]
MSVYIPIPITELEQAKEQPSRTYKIVFERGRIYSIGSCDGKEAVEQYIKKALLTPRFRCLVYDNQYGSEIKQTIIADDVSNEYTEAEMPRIVRDAILCDSRILDVYGFSFGFKNDEAYIKFEADTIFGKLNIEEALKIV